MVSEHTQRGGRLRRPFAALSRLSRVGDIPVVVMLAWAGWLAVPWSFNGLAQARAAAAAAAAEPPPSSHASDTAPPPSGLASHGTPSSALASQTALASHSTPPSAFGSAAPVAEGGALCGLVAGGAAPGLGGRPAGAAWGIPAPAVARPAATVRPARPVATADAFATLAPHAATAAPHTAEAVPHTAEAVPHTAEAVHERTEAALGQVDTVLGWPEAAIGGGEVVASERARIAGEVHDAAGHGLAAIAMQAGLALVALDDDPEQARASLRAIRETSTTALAQLRAALDGIDPPAADLPGLIAGVRAAGLPVDVEPADPAVPAHLRAAVYRVVRESLTNVLRHAGPTRASVRLADGPCAFVLEVADRGAGWNGAAEGRGLAGMRAHVTEAGGRLTAGPRVGGGFQVTARFPRSEA
ncbi:sensor histidine kinase [Nonomuraea sp. NPDC005692]|uniref:sensor histidine kinase n=1 Tax=Nonomuraea sp. NPDC005692 TaxID=3157168 RepID=UPI0033F32FF6